MKQSVRYTIRQYDMIPPDTRVLCGLSGGADSVSMVLCLQELGFDVCACHLHHGLRGKAADMDAEFCRNLCETHGIPFRLGYCDAAAEAQKQKLSIETAARQLRYDFFTRCAAELGAQRIATAHTADDNLETMLFRLIRGTGSAGLSGIPPVRDNIIRPLLAVERRQVETFLTERGQDWCTDATNLDDSCTRNRLRHHVIPALRDIEPAAARHAWQTAGLLRQDNDCLDSLAAVHGTQVDVGTLLQLPEALQSRQLRQLLEQAGTPMGEVSAKHIRQLCTLAYKKHGSVSLPGNRQAIRQRNVISIEKTVSSVPEIRLPPEKPVRFGAYTVQFARKISDIHSSFKLYPISCDTIMLSDLSVRTWQREDRMTLPGTRGSRTLKRLYAERGISPQVRDTLPILCCQGKLVAAAGIGTEQAFYGNAGFFAVRYEDGSTEREE